MIIKRLNCSGFRNFKEITVLPNENMNIIFGNNAEGKTNLLEAIWLFCGAKSFRGSKDREMVGFESEFAQNTCDYILGGIEKSAKITITKNRQAELNQKKLSSAGKLAGNFFCIVFSPQDLNLVNSGPAIRRRFLDTAIGQIYPLYNEKLRRYVKAVSQRNSILKDSRYSGDLLGLLDDFEHTLSSLAFDILRYRRRYCELLSQTAPEIYSGIASNKEHIDIEYSSEIGKSNSVYEIFELYKASRREDIITKGTSIGPHRDDILINLDKRPLKNFGSQGQRRSAALALKLSEATVLKQVTGEYPIALLDDVMSELDKSRQNFILNHIKNWQVFITCCDPDNISALKSGSVFHMVGGNII